MKISALNIVSEIQVSFLKIWYDRKYFLTLHSKTNH